MLSKKNINVYLICGGLYHDFEYARLELLEHLGRHKNIRTLVGADYSDATSISEADAVLTYTTDVMPTPEELTILEEFFKSGKRWFALHGTNSVIDIDAKGYASSPRTHPRFMQMMGSQFIAHPPKGVFEVKNAQPDHPLVQGIETFVVDDELYLLETHGELEVLLYTHYNGKAMKGFTEKEFFSDEVRPILYLHNWDKGKVLYLNLGHCRGHLDMEPLMSWYPEVERCSWESPVFRELVDRGILWMLGDNP